MKHVSCSPVIPGRGWGLAKSDVDIKTGAGSLLATRTCQSGIPGDLQKAWSAVAETTALAGYDGCWD
jgi:hypothetical protein